MADGPEQLQKLRCSQCKPSRGADSRLVARRSVRYNPCIVSYKKFAGQTRTRQSRFVLQNALVRSEFKLLQGTKWSFVYVSRLHLVQHTLGTVERQYTWEYTYCHILWIFVWKIYHESKKDTFSK